MNEFERSVFINCPFDDGYLSLLRPLVFSILYLDFQPRLALERADSEESRIRKIVELIQDSKFGIHDLSRCRSSKRGEFFRLNMPLELGIDIGCKLFRRGKWKQKRILILETERFRYQAAISDLAGSDIFAHRNDPEELVLGVRDWMVQEAGASPVPANRIYGAFLDFMAFNHSRLEREGWKAEHIHALRISELQGHMRNWLSRHRRVPLRKKERRGLA